MCFRMFVCVFVRVRVRVLVSVCVRVRLCASVPVCIRTALLWCFLLATKTRPDMSCATTLTTSVGRIAMAGQSWQRQQNAELNPNVHHPAGRTVPLYSKPFQAWC